MLKNTYFAKHLRRIFVFAMYEGHKIFQLCTVIKLTNSKIQGKFFLCPVHHLVREWKIFCCQINYKQKDKNAETASKDLNGNNWITNIPNILNKNC